MDKHECGNSYPGCAYVSDGSETPKEGAPGGGDAGAGGTTGDSLLHIFRGSIAVSQVTDADLERLDAGRARRGFTSAWRPPTRALSEEQQLQALCEWLHDEHSLNLMGTVTFSDDYARRHGIYTFRRALDDVWLGLTREIVMREHYGYPWKFILAAEHHKTARTVPHVHLALEAPERVAEAVCGDLWSFFYSSRGRSRFEPMRDTTAATLYGLKDTVKAAKEDTSAIAMRLWRPRRRQPVRVCSRDLRGGGGDPPRV